MSHILQKKKFGESCSIRWVMSEKVNNLWVIFLRKSSILWVNKKKKGPIHQVINKKVWLLESNNLLVSNSLSPFVQRVQSIESNSQKRFNSLSHVEKRLNSLSHVQKVEVFESCKKKLKSLSLVRRFNSLSHLREKSSMRCVIWEKRRSILSVMFFKRSSILGVGKISSLNFSRFNYVSHIKESSTLWVILKCSIL